MGSEKPGAKEYTHSVYIEYKVVEKGKPLTLRYLVLSADQGERATKAYHTLIDLVEEYREVNSVSK